MEKATSGILKLPVTVLKNYNYTYISAESKLLAAVSMSTSVITSRWQIPLAVTCRRTASACAADVQRC